MSSVIHWIGRIIAGLAGVFFLLSAFRAASSLPPLNLGAMGWAALTAALLVNISVIAILALAWHLMIRGSGGSVPLLETLSIYGISQFAKYLPGNVAHHVGRVGLARTRGVSVSMALTTMGFETVLMMGVSASLAAVAMVKMGENLLALIPVPVMEHGQLILASGGGGCIVLVALLAISRAYGWRPFASIRLGRMPSAYAVLSSTSIYVLCFLSMGFALELMACGIFGSPAQDLLLITGLFAFCWMVGFITPGAPAGLGIREVLLVTVLTPIYGHTVSVCLSLVLRLVTTSGDGITFGLALLGRRRWTTQPQAFCTPPMD